MNRLKRVPTEWQLRSRVLSLGTTTRVMGVVNITPDSFSDGGLYLDPERAVEHAVQLLEEGADLIDLGPESTRPGSGAGGADALSAAEEQDRLLPVLEGLLKRKPEALVAVDTYKSATARAAIKSGAQVVNDVSGFAWDEAMAETCADLRCGVVVMHTRGTPAEWRTQRRLTTDEVLPLVREGLKKSLNQALTAGITADRLVMDPGYGFGKRLDVNYTLLARQAELLELGRPLLAGVSRKSFLSLSSAAGQPRSEERSLDLRETASVAAQVTAILNGASLIRVHEVRAAVAAAAVADAVLAAV